MVHKTEYIRKTLSPMWKPFTVLTRTLCNGDPDRFVVMLLCRLVDCFVVNENHLKQAVNMES